MEKKINKQYIISMCILVLGLLGMLMNLCFGPFADWIIRVFGVVMMIGIVAVSYNFVRMRKDGK